MFLDARAIEPDQVIDADIVIVGAGAAGITIAMELVGTDKRILVLESGGLEFDDETQALYEGRLTAHDAVTLHTSRLRFFGGTTNHWGGFCLPLESIDFKERRGFSDTGWPLSLDDLTPFYRRAHSYCEIGEFQYTAGELFPGGASAMLPLNHSVVETVVNRQSPPTRFGQKFRKPLRDAKNVQVMLWANVTRVDMGTSGAIDRVLVQTLRGTSFTVTASVFVLACGAIENARVMLASLRPDGVAVGNQGDCVGRYYMDHIAGVAAFISLDGYRLPEPYFTGNQKSPDGIQLHFLTRLSEAVQTKHGLLNASFWWTPFETDERKRNLAFSASAGVRGLKDLAKHALGRDVQSRVPEAYCAFVNNLDEMLLSLASSRSEAANAVLLRFEAEQSPNSSNRVVLGAGRDKLGMPTVDLNWAPTDRDIQSVIDSAVLIGKEVGQAGLGRLRLESHDRNRYWGVGTSWHQMGTTRMGLDTSRSVVNSDCRVHDSTNLYVAGASVFPTGGRSNPTLTLVALAIRLADHLKRIRL